METLGLGVGELYALAHHHHRQHLVLVLLRCFPRSLYLSCHDLIFNKQSTSQGYVLCCGSQPNQMLAFQEDTGKVC